LQNLPVHRHPESPDGQVLKQGRGIALQAHGDLGL